MILSLYRIYKNFGVYVYQRRAKKKGHEITEH